MHPKEIKALIKLLRAQGVTHYKSAEIELDLGPIVPRETAVKAMSVKPSESTPIPHKDLNPLELIKLSDVELLNKIYPDYTEDAEDTATEQN